jgi:hypothetical protein
VTDMILVDGGHAIILCLVFRRWSSAIASSVAKRRSG